MLRPPNPPLPPKKNPKIKKQNKNTQIPSIIINNTENHYESSIKLKLTQTYNHTFQ